MTNAILPERVEIQLHTFRLWIPKVKITKKDEFHPPPQKPPISSKRVVAQKCSLALWIREKKLQEQICPPKCLTGHPSGPICKKRAKSIDVQHFEIPTLLHFLVNLWKRGKNVLRTFVNLQSYPVLLEQKLTPYYWEVPMAWGKLGLAVLLLEHFPYIYPMG